MDTAYVITWRYSDGSGSGATAVFTDKARAERLVEILDKTDSMRQFKIEAVPFDLGNTPAPKEAPSEASRGEGQKLRKCLYCEREMIFGSECFSASQSADCEMRKAPGTPGGGR